MAQAPQGFRNADRLTSIVRVLLYMQMVAAIVVIVSDVLEYNVLSDIQHHNFAFPDQLMAAARASDERQRYVSIADLLVLIVSGIAILRWIYVASINARSLGAENMRFSAGSSVWWFFVPILSLWKPFQAVKEIWQASHNPGDWQHVDTGALLGIWWGVWLLNGFVDQVSFRLSLHAHAIDELIHANLVDQASSVLGIPLAIVTLLLVDGIYRAQQQQLHRQAIAA
jgi:hypothetical protein